MERGRSSLALTSLHTVAKALGTDVTTFFEVAPSVDDLPLPHVARAAEPSSLAIAASQRTYKLLSKRVPGLLLEPVFVTVYPSDTVEEAYAHDGEEFAYVLSGEVRFIIGGTEYRLATGDSIHFASTVPHAIHNDTDDPCHVVWILTPRLF